jgi:hypothetical protein
MSGTLRPGRVGGAMAIVTERPTGSIRRRTTGTVRTAATGAGTTGTIVTDPANRE